MKPTMNHAYIPVGGVNTLHLFAPSICTTRTSCLSVCGGADVRIPRAVTYMLSAPGSDIASVLAKVGPARRGMCAPILLKMTVPDYMYYYYTPHHHNVIHKLMRLEVRYHNILYVANKI